VKVLFWAHMIILFDTDGIIIQRKTYFSQRFSDEFDIPMEKVRPFFNQEFQLCLVGKADIKVELKKYIKEWGWEKTIDDFLVYWFECESDIDKRIIESVKILREKGVRCYLHTNNEKYRTEYLFEKLKLKNYFDGIFFSAKLGFKKPQQEFWFAIYNHLGKPNKQEVFLLDDDEKNVLSAKKFGFQSEFYSSFNSYERQIKKLFG